MGNCCGSPSAIDDSGPRHHAATTRPGVSVSGPGRTLGQGDASGGVDPRTAAAIAAEVYPIISLPLYTTNIGFADG